MNGKLFMVSGGANGNVHLTRKVGPYWAAPENWVGFMHIRSAKLVIAHVDALLAENEGLLLELEGLGQPGREGS